jgi:hypothetical protein
VTQDRTRATCGSPGTRTVGAVTSLTQPDEFLRRVRPAAAQPTADAAPAGQVHASVTEAFIRLVTLLDKRTDNPARFDVMVRDRATGRTHAVPVTEDMAVALIDASCAWVSGLRPPTEHARTADTAPVRTLRSIPGGAQR